MKKVMKLEEWKKSTLSGINILLSNTLEDGLRSQIECMKQLQSKKGPYYRKWQRAMKLHYDRQHKENHD